MTSIVISYNYKISVNIIILISYIKNINSHIIHYKIPIKLMVPLEPQLGDLEPKNMTSAGINSSLPKENHHTEAQLLLSSHDGLPLPGHSAPWRPADGEIVQLEMAKFG